MTDEAYAKALAEALKTLICTEGDNGISYFDARTVRSVLARDNGLYILRGLTTPVSGPFTRIEAAGPQVPTLVDFIMSKNCPVSESLTEADKTILLRIRKRAIQRPGG